MKDLIKEVALEGAEKFGVVADDSEIVDLVTWCLAELSKRAEAVGYLNPNGGFLVASYMPQATGLERETHTIPAFTFPPIHDIEAIENRVAEACAKICMGPSNDGNIFADDCAEAIRSGEWRKYK